MAHCSSPSYRIEHHLQISVILTAGEAEEGVPTELDLAAGKLFMEWLDAEKAAEEAAEKLRLEQAEADVSPGLS